jgi:hypothetical protein
MRVEVCKLEDKNKLQCTGTGGCGRFISPGTLMVVKMEGMNIYESLIVKDYVMFL